MEVLSVKRLQPFCGRHHGLAVRQINEVTGSSSGSGALAGRVEAHKGFWVSERSQSEVVCIGVNTKVSTEEYTHRLCCGVRLACARSKLTYTRNGSLAGDEELALKAESLRIGIGRTKRSVWVRCSAGDAPSANLSDSTLGEEPSRSSTTSSSWFSVGRSWQYGLKKARQLNLGSKADWNRLIFNWRPDEPMWTVPWTGQTIFQVMVLWFAAFWVMGSWVLPIAAQIAGFSRHTLSFRGQALYSLVTDIAEGTVGIWILKRCLTQFVPLPDGWFPLKWKGKWLSEACWGCLLFPFVNKLSQLNLYLIPTPNLNASYVEQSMMSRDPVATLLYAVVISICAPVWEEVIFRGFLLPSMTRYVPLGGAIFFSALAFALAHFSMQRLLPLTFLGLVMGFVFVRSRNLLASIVLHSLWNGFAFLELL